MIHRNALVSAKNIPSQFILSTIWGSILMMLILEMRNWASKDWISVPKPCSQWTAEKAFEASKSYLSNFRNYILLPVFLHCPHFLETWIWNAFKEFKNKNIKREIYSQYKWFRLFIDSGKWVTLRIYKKQKQETTVPHYIVHQWIARRVFHCWLDLPGRSKKEEGMRRSTSQQVAKP